jgi:RNA recognition motif-containing protein
MNIYIGNLPYSMTEETLEEMFKAYGEVASVRIIKDKFTGNSKGFAFVEMGSEDSAQEAIDGLNGKEVEGRALRINKALPPQQKTGGGRDGGRDSRGGGGGGYKPRSNNRYE